VHNDILLTDLTSALGLEMEQPLLAVTGRSGAQVGRRRPVIQGWPAGGILSGSPGAGFGRQRTFITRALDWKAVVRV
jgi:hypothetical protein